VLPAWENDDIAEGQSDKSTYLPFFRLIPQEYLFMSHVSLLPIKTPGNFALSAISIIIQVISSVFLALDDVRAVLVMETLKKGVADDHGIFRSA
jgi:hypothetical protein